MDRNTGAMPADVLAQRQRRKTAYRDAVRHWARHGSARVDALGAREAIARLPQPSDADAEAHARFRLGQHLQAHGQAAEAGAAFSNATALHPASWAMWWQVAAKDARGLASGAWRRIPGVGDDLRRGAGAGPLVRRSGRFFSCPASSSQSARTVMFLPAAVDALG